MQAALEEYLEFEKKSKFKHEHVDEHLCAMTGLTRRHSLISGRTSVR